MAVDHEVVSEAQWLAARRDFLEQEKEFTRARDAHNAERQGWHFPWYSSHGSDFNYDFGVSFTDEQIASGTVYYNFRDTEFTPQEAPGLSVFYRDEDGQVYRTYSCYARGLDMLNGAYHHLDLVPRGRDEEDLPFSMAWLDFQFNYK